MNTNAAIPSIVNRKVLCAGKICGLGLHPRYAASKFTDPSPPHTAEVFLLVAGFQNQAELSFLL